MKLTKKATLNIMKHVEKVNPHVSKNTSFDEAWVILATAWGIEGEIYHTIKKGTQFFIYKEDDLVGVIDIPDGFDKEKSDFNWTSIYKAADEFIIKNKLWKKPKKKITQIEAFKEKEEEEVVINKKSEELKTKYNSPKSKAKKKK